MNETYGIDPASPAGPDELVTLLQRFGPTEGRFIVGFPDDWVDQVKRQLDSALQVQRHRALTCLDRTRRALIPTNKPYRSERPWSLNAHELKGEVDAVIGPRECPADHLPIDKVLYEVDSLPDARGEHVLRTAKKYAEAAWPLFAISRKVVLVDRYFRLRFIDGNGESQVDKHHREVLKSFLMAAVRWHKVAVVCLHVSKVALQDDQDGRMFEDDLSTVQDEAGASDLDLEYCLLADDQHARYLLGAGCGLQFDHGFSAGKVGPSNHVHWLSASELRPLLERFNLPES